MEHHFLTLIKNGNKAAFDEVFLTYFKMLHAYAFLMIKNTDEAEEVVQNVFVKIWAKRNQLKTDGFLKAFLYRSVHNEAINYMKQQKVRSNLLLNRMAHSKNETGNLNEEIAASEMERHIHSAINSLPEKCREVFQLSRFDQMRYHEIASTLNISIKTVENQMGKALKLLRVKMAEFLILIFVFFNWQ